MQPNNRTARLAGFLYLILSILGIFALMYVPKELIVRGDAEATAGRIMQHDVMFRLGIAAELAGSVLMIFIAMVLYRLFNQLDRMQSALMVLFAAVDVPISFIGVVNEIAALNLLKGASYLSIFNEAQRHSLAYFFLRIHTGTIVVNEIFWGVWLVPFGILVIRSRFLPKFLGYLLLVNGAAYVIDSLLALIAPQYSGSFATFARIAETGEIWIMLWLLIMGAKVETNAQPDLSYAAR